MSRSRRHKKTLKQWAAETPKKFRKFGRGSARAKARRALRKGEEPEPVYPEEKEWFH